MNDIGPSIYELEGSGIKYDPPLLTPAYYASESYLNLFFTPMLMPENDVRRMVVYSEGRCNLVEFVTSFGALVIFLQFCFSLNPTILGPHCRFGGLDGM